MPEQQKFCIYINSSAGTVTELGKDKLEKIIIEANIPVAHIWFLEAPQIIEKLQQDTHNEPILIGGGDGTIRSCAKYAIGSATPFGILPLGTMNLLAKDLGIPVKIEHCLRDYARGHITYDMDVGYVNGDIFLCCASLGTMPETSRFRERNRNRITPILLPQLTAYIMEKMDKKNHHSLFLTLDKKHRRIRTAALVISNSQYGDQGQWSEDNFKRPSLQDNILGIYAITPDTLWDKVRFLLRLGAGNWKQDNVLQEWFCQALTIHGKDKTVLLSLDGEALEFQMPLEFSVRPKGLTLLKPAL